MKEEKETDKEIILTLQKENFLEIPLICQNCIHHVIDVVLSQFDQADFSISVAEDGLFRLIIITSSDED